MEETETNENSSAEPVETPKHVVDALARLGSLTYQHRQLIKDGDVLSLLEQFVAARESSDWMYIVGTVGFGANFVFGLPVGQLNWISGFIAAACFVSYRTQKQTITSVTQVVREFADTQGYKAPSRESQLQTELRVHYSLTYQQTQQLKAGDAFTVATDIAASHRRNGWLQPVVMSVCALPQLTSAAFGAKPVLTSPQPITLRFWLVVLHTVLYVGFGIWMATMQIRRARKLEELMGLHPAEMTALTLGAGTGSDNESPYRSPQFR